MLGQHGPTTQFQLLMGTNESKRDRLAASYQVNSLFIMDFAPAGQIFRTVMKGKRRYTLY